MSPAVTPEGPPDLPGYSYVQHLGHGGYADVYLYEQRMPTRKVAVKVLRSTGLTEALRQQFTDEANVMAQLADHPNIVPVFSADLASDGRPFIVMMFYPRDSLGERAARERFSVDEVLRIGVQIASAVETAHRAGILHRDIKPANILTSQYGAPGLTDFGIAGQIVAIDADDDTGVSVPWSPPEVLYATAAASRASDIYSLAATLWHLLVGRSPFELTGGDNGAYALMARIRDAAPPDTGRADVPTSMERLLKQALAKDPKARPQTALDLARVLQTIEQELRLPRTEVVVLEENDLGNRSRPAAPSDDLDTRIRAPQRVQAQTPHAPVDPGVWAPPPDFDDPNASVDPSTGRPPVPPMPQPPTSVKPAVVSAQSPYDAGPAVAPVPSDDTILRPTVSPDAGPITISVEPATRSPWAWRVPILALGVVVLVAVGLGIALSGGGGKKKPEAEGQNPATRQSTGTAVLPDQSCPEGVDFQSKPAARGTTVTWNLCGSSARPTSYLVRWGDSAVALTGNGVKTTAAAVTVHQSKHEPHTLYFQIQAFGTGAIANGLWFPQQPQPVTVRK